MRDNAARWLDAFVWAQTGAAIILAAAALLVLGIAAYWLHRLARWALGRARHRTDLTRMRRRPTPRPPATPQSTDDYWTIRRAWHMTTREEIKR